MATTMDIRLDYGAWPGDEGDTTESATSRDGSPTFNHRDLVDGRQPDSLSRTQHSSALSLSGLFSDTDDTALDQDLLDAEMHTVRFASTSQNTSQNRSRTRHPPRGSEGINLLTSTQGSAYDSPVIDLTESPPQPSARLSSTTIAPSTSRRTSRPPPSQDQSTMPPTRRSHHQPGRAAPMSPSPHHTQERPTKRRRLFGTSPATEQPETASNNASEIEAVDLTHVNNESDLSKVISKQQQDAVQSQMKEAQGDDSSGRTSLSSYKCPICMDTPEDATTTICGHLFCHKCIHDTLRFSQQQRRDDAGISKAKGTCPVCRKPLARKDEPGVGRTLVPMEIKLSTRADWKGKGVVRGNGEASAVPGRLLGGKMKGEREGSADMWRDLTTLEHG